MLRHSARKHRGRHFVTATARRAATLSSIGRPAGGRRLLLACSRLMTCPRATIVGFPGGRVMPPVIRRSVLAPWCGSRIVGRRPRRPRSRLRLALPDVGVRRRRQSGEDACSAAQEACAALGASFRMSPCGAAGCRRESPGQRVAAHPRYPAPTWGRGDRPHRAARFRPAWLRAERDREPSGTTTSATTETRVEPTRTRLLHPPSRQPFALQP